MTQYDYMEICEKGQWKYYEGMKKIHKNLLDGMLGIAAGVMVAASFWSLLSPAISMADIS